MLVKNNPELLLKTISTLQPYDLSQLFKILGRGERIWLIKHIPINEAAEAIEYLEPELQYSILHHLDESIASPLLHQISSDMIVDMLLAIHPLQAAKMLLLLPDNYRQQINNLMTYSEETAGSLMTVDYISARAHWSSEKTINHVRKIGNAAEIISYIYVTNTRGELVGIVSLRDIILAEPSEPIGNITSKNIISVSAELEQEEVANIMARYDFYALPVVNHQNRIIGIITYDDIVDVLTEEATEDFQRLGGSHPLSESYFKTSIWSLYTKRIVWLLILLLGGTYTTAISSYYQDITAKWIALSAFIPLLIGTGGNTGSQITTTLIRSLSLGEVRFQDIFVIIRRELATGLLVGVSISLAIFSIYLILEQGNISNIGYVVSSTALFIVLWSSLVSSALPLLLDRFGFDPSVISGPLITTLVDGTGLLIYFFVAQLVLT